MTAQTRSTNKGKFNVNDVPSEADYADLIDSFLSLTDTTAQSVTSPMTVSGALTVTSFASAMVTAAASGGTVHTVPTTAAGYLTVQVSGRTVAIPYFEV